MNQIVFYIFGAIISLLGIVGIFLPLFPGVPMVFAGVLIVCIASKFSFISSTAVAIMGILALLSIAVDYLSGLLGAKYAGAGLYGSLGAVAGAIFGVGILGPIGVILGPALGVLIFEIIAKRKIEKSARVAAYTLFSTFIGMMLNLVIAVAILLIFVGAIFI
ncbi:MAG: hypothetical protein BWY43_00699 [candidate division WS2 bacterium ADurb.Bin280]|uniref:DUF456 domain-containing protein n=1 Tax=candidate division WS2 bacterium ADurb.Bin280 TaxID=1852829 RepID=A0A1V5SDA4_9BACT|nr:MAG: hypothetical protein BWY43_00699 [candidate division WS2 bacterium ADurb.Bin280]